MRAEARTQTLRAVARLGRAAGRSPAPPLPPRSAAPAAAAAPCAPPYGRSKLQRGAEDHRQTRQSTILREQQCLAGRTCAEVAERTLLRLRKPSVVSAASKNHPKTARRAAQDGRPRRRRRPGSSCGHRADPPFNPSPAALRRRNGRAPPPMSAITTSQALYVTLQGQQEQRGAGAPPSQRRQRVPRSSRNPHFQTSLRLEVALPSACAGS